jgi:hypothetical protein
VAREFVPEYIQEDICQRPERNLRPQPWEDTDRWTDDGICFDYSKPNNPTNPSDSEGIELNLPNSDSNLSNCSDAQIPNTEPSGENGSIFGKFFNFLGGSITPEPMSTLSPDDIDREQEEVEKRMMCWGWWPMGRSDDSCIDITHPAYNPPMFLGEYIPPP